MKKLFTILIVVAISATMVFAQKGTIALGVDSRIDNISWQEYRLAPTVGYFLTNNFMVGIGVQYNSVKNVDLKIYTNPWNVAVSKTLEENSFEKSIELMPFLRYYFGDFYISTGFLIASGSGYQESKEGVWVQHWNTGIVTYEGYNLSTIEYESTSFGMSFRVGYSLMWNDRISVEPSFGFSRSSGNLTNRIITTPYNTGRSDTFESKSPAPDEFNMGIALGIHVRIGK